MRRSTIFRKAKPIHSSQHTQDTRHTPHRRQSLTESVQWNSANYPPGPPDDVVPPAWRPQLHRNAILSHRRLRGPIRDRIAIDCSGGFPRPARAGPEEPPGPFKLAGAAGGGRKPARNTLLEEGSARRAASIIASRTTIRTAYLAQSVPRALKNLALHRHSRTRSLRRSRLCRATTSLLGFPTCLVSMPASGKPSRTATSPAACKGRAVRGTFSMRRAAASVRRERTAGEVMYVALIGRSGRRWSFS